MWEIGWNTSSLWLTRLELTCEAGPYGHPSRMSFDSFFFCHIKQIKVRRLRKRQSATSRAAQDDSSAQLRKRLYFYEF